MNSRINPGKTIHSVHGLKQANLDKKDDTEQCLELKVQYTIIMVTHNMQQASRIADWTAFFNTEIDFSGKRSGKLIEFSPTEQLFGSPVNQETEDYINGVFG